MHDPERLAFTSGRLQLNAWRWGDPSAPLLLLVHGGRDHARNWDWVAQAFAHSFHVIAPDLRGHGDSGWTTDGEYSLASMMLDLAELSRAIGGAPASVIGHSLGGNVALRFAAAFPERVRRLVVIEGLGFSPAFMRERAAREPADLLRKWAEDRRQSLGRTQRRYATIEDACARMRAKHGFLSEAQAMHLTIHGTRQDEDGSFGWKFDPLVRTSAPPDSTAADLQRIWARVACPTLLAYGTRSWASNPETDGRAAFFADARLALFDAGHWLHHELTEAFIGEATAALA